MAGSSRKGSMVSTDMSIENLKSEVRERVQRHQREAEMELKILDLLPVEPKYCHGHGYKSDASAEYEVQDRKEAVEIASKFKWFPLVRVSDTFCSFVPQDSLKEKTLKEIEDGKVECIEIQPLYWELDPYSHQTHYSINGFALCGEFRVSVEFNLKTDPAFLKEDHIKDHRGNIIQYKYVLHNSPHGMLTKFASGDYKRPGKHVVSFERGIGAATIEQCLGIEDD